MIIVYDDYMWSMILVYDGYMWFYDFYLWWLCLEIIWCDMFIHDDSVKDASLTCCERKRTELQVYLID